MSWITVDTKLPNHPKMAALPNDAARWGWLCTLLEAKEQRKPGTFADERHYRHVMARHGRFLKDYLSAGLMDKDETGTLHVHDWRQHQWAVAKAQQRETPGGHEEDNAKTFLGQEEDASRAVRVPVLVDVVTEEGSGEKPPDPADAYWTLTGRYPTDKTLSWVDDLAANFGSEPVIRALAKAHLQDSRTNTLLGRTQDILRAEARAIDVKEQSVERQRQKERRPVEHTPEQKAAIEAEIRRMLAA